MAAQSSTEQLQDLIDRSYKYLKSAYLRPFLLTLPLHGAAAQSNQQGIREKILKNRSFIVTPHNPRDSLSRDGGADCVGYIHQVIDRLITPEIVGFVLVVAEYLGGRDEEEPSDEDAVSTNAYQYRPVAGGIVELLDDHERAVRGIWCRRSLSPEVSESLLKVTTMRLLAHAFEWQHPSASGKRVTNKLVSSLEIHSLTFPRDSYNFLTTPQGLSLSKHWETPDDGGAHNDSPSQKCKCFKLAEKPEAWQFWGVSESRFVKTWAARKDSLIPEVPPLSVLEQFSSAKRVQAKRTAAAGPAANDSSSSESKKALRTSEG